MSLPQQAEQIRPGRLQAWVLASRPATLTGAIAPVLVGSACAFDTEAFDPAPALAALVVAIMLQVATNMANDVFDYEKGADTEERHGPLRVTQAGLLTPAQVKQGMWTCFAVAVAAGVYLAVHVASPPGTWVQGALLLGVGVAAILAGIGYTAGPFPLGYNGLGDVFVLIFFGFVAVCGTTFVQARTITPIAWWAGLSMGTFTTALLVVNNVRDRQTDRRAGKRTIPARLGRAAGLAEYAALLGIGYAATVVIALTAHGSICAVLPLASMPLGSRLFRDLCILPEGKELNRVLVGTAKLMLLHGVLLSAGIALGALTR